MKKEKERKKKKDEMLLLLGFSSDSWNEVDTIGLSNSIYLPWSIELITALEDKWDWDELSCNKFIPWSIELIKAFEDKWNWYLLSENESIPWSLELIKVFENKWDWDYLCNNAPIYKLFKDALNDKFVLELMKTIEREEYPSSDYDASDNPCYDVTDADQAEFDSWDEDFDGWRENY